MTKAEIDNFADSSVGWAILTSVLLPKVKGEAVGFALALPDYNQVLRYLDGRLFPFGLLKLLRYQRKINAARILILG